MFETAMMILAGYAGALSSPWWCAALMGAAAGIWNVRSSLRDASWKEAAILELGDLSEREALALYGWMSALLAGFASAVYYVTRMCVGE
jgi:hypothetical protein